MGRIKVVFFGAIQGVVKKREDQITIPDSDITVKELFETLSESYGPNFKEMMLGKQGMSPLVFVFLNGEYISNCNHSEIRNEHKLGSLSEGSEVQVTLVTQMSGG